MTDKHFTHVQLTASTCEAASTTFIVYPHRDMIGNADLLNSHEYTRACTYQKLIHEAHFKGSFPRIVRMIKISNFFLRTFIEQNMLGISISIQCAVCVEDRLTKCIIAGAY